MPMHEYQKQMYKKIGVVAALVILPVAGFFAGMQYQKQTTPPATATNETRGFGGGPRMMSNRGIGTVKSISDTSVTITDRMSGEEKTYTISSNTAYKDGNADATASDVKVGDNVMLILDEDDNTKVTTIIVNPVTVMRSDADPGTSIVE